MSARLKINGIQALMPLPMTKKYEVNEEECRKVVDWCVAQGAQGVIATGSVGEFVHLEKEERFHVLDIIIDQVRRHPGIAAIAMTSGADTLQTIGYTRYAADIGYDAAMVVPPYYWKVNNRECYRHYEMITKAVDIPLIIYHNPELSKFTITPEFAVKLSEIPGIIGMKEVVKDMVHLQRLYELTGHKWMIMQTFRTYLYSLILGATGGMPNIFALPAYVRITELFKKGEIQKAVPIQQVLNHIFPKQVEETVGNLGRIKAIGSIVSGCEFGPPRPPYEEASPEAIKLIRDSCDHLAAVIEASR